MKKMGLSLYYQSRTILQQKRGCDNHIPSSGVWSLARRSGCAPALPYPPARPQ